MERPSPQPRRPGEAHRPNCCWWDWYIDLALSSVQGSYKWRVSSRHRLLEEWVELWFPQLRWTTHGQSWQEVRRTSRSRHLGQTFWQGWSDHRPYYLNRDPQEKREHRIKTSQGSTKAHGGRNRNKRKAPKWKYDRSASTTNELKKNGKTYRWCTGPGHRNVPMRVAPNWVAPEPDQCTKMQQDGTSRSKKTFHESKTMYSRQALICMLKTKGNLSDDEIKTIVEAIIAVMDSWRGRLWKHILSFYRPILLLIFWFLIDDFIQSRCGVAWWFICFSSSPPCNYFNYHSQAFSQEAKDLMATNSYRCTTWASSSFCHTYKSRCTLFDFLRRSLVFFELQLLWMTHLFCCLKFLCLSALSSSSGFNVSHPTSSFFQVHCNTCPANSGELSLWQRSLPFLSCSRTFPGRHPCQPNTIPTAPRAKRITTTPRTLKRSFKKSLHLHQRKICMPSWLIRLVSSKKTVRLEMLEPGMLTMFLLSWTQPQVDRN